MKITIDTKEDSHEDIRKLVAFLSTLSDGSRVSTNIFEDSSPSLVENTPKENAFTNMFGDNSNVSNETQSAFVNIFDEVKNESNNNSSNNINSNILSNNTTVVNNKPPLYEEDVSEEEKQASKLVIEY